MLIARSKIEDLPIITRDPAFRFCLDNILW
jgi:hypothetical protein